MRRPTNENLCHSFMIKSGTVFPFVFKYLVNPLAALPTSWSTKCFSGQFWPPRLQQRSFSDARTSIRIGSNRDSSPRRSIFRPVFSRVQVSAAAQPGVEVRNTVSDARSCLDIRGTGPADAPFAERIRVNTEHSSRFLCRQEFWTLVSDHLRTDTLGHPRNSLPTLRDHHQLLHTNAVRVVLALQ